MRVAIEELQVKTEKSLNQSYVHVYVRTQVISAQQVHNVMHLHNVMWYTAMYHIAGFLSGGGRGSICPP